MIGHATRAATAAALAFAAVLLSPALTATSLAEQPPGTVTLAGSAPRALPGAAAHATPPDTQIEFAVALQLRDPAGAAALESAVSVPGSPGYRDYLTPAQWEQRFSPTEASVEAVTSWLRSQGIAVDAVTPDHMTIEASASAAVLERVLHTSLSEYAVAGRSQRLASGPLSIPASLAGTILAITGVDQKTFRPAGFGRPGSETSSRAGGRARPAAGGAAIEAPTWPLTPQPCSGYWGEKLDTTDPAFGEYPGPLPYGDCGYVPAQLQGAYDLSGPISEGDDGSGVTVAITDAFASPTLYSDAHEWSRHNAPSQVLNSGHFSEIVPKHFTEFEACGGSGWSIEQTLDVESVHSTAPGAHILYVGAKNCEGALYRSIQMIVDRHLAEVISNSWTGGGTEETTPIAENAAFDNVLLMAGGTGVGVQFSAGDEGDDFSVQGNYVPQYPPESPYATGVGGTSIEIGASDQRSEELGWSNSISALCDEAVEKHREAVEVLVEHPVPCTGSLFGRWLPKAPGGYWAGGGGDTSFEYAEPYYQQGVVPAAIADRNRALTGIANRVVPDISYDADPFTGLKEGETLSEPDGERYEEFPIGGTSLASPLFAGEEAVADQAAGVSLGFINPLLYRLDASPHTAAGAFYDILPPKQKQAFAIVNYVNEDNEAEGVYTTVRTLGYEGLESFCPFVGECVEHKITIKAAKGYDSMTGIGSPGPEFIKDAATP